VRQTLDNEVLLRRIEKTNYVLMGAVPALAWVFLSRSVGVGIFIGALIATLSFQILKWQLRKAFRIPGKVPAKGSVFFGYYLRYLGVFFVVFMVMYYGWADPVPFIIGLSTVVVSILVGGGLEILALSTKQGES
jgi:hypothetical protein